MRTTLFCLFILLIALALPAAEGMFPVNGITPAIAADMKAMGCRFDPADLWRPGEKCLAMAVVNLGGHRLVRLGRRPDHHQPPRGLRRRAEPLLARAQLHPRRLPGRRPRTGSPRSRLQRAGHDRFRERYPPLPRRPAPGAAPRKSAIAWWKRYPRSWWPRARRPRATSAPWSPSTAAWSFTWRPISRSATCAWSTCRRAPSANTAARSTTGCGRATPAISPSCARMSAGTAARPITPGTMSPSGRCTISPSPGRRCAKATSP